MEQILALRQAANALIGTATGPTLRTVLRALLDGEEFADLQPPLTSHGNGKHADAPAPSAAAGKTSPTRMPKPGQSADATEWLTLRTRVQQTRDARGMNNADLATELKASPVTLRVALGTRRPPTKSMQQRLTKWVDSEATRAPASEVAADPVPFRRNGPAGGDSAGIKAG